MDVNTPVTRELDQKNIPYQVFVHPGQLKSLEQAANERNQQPEQVVRSIVFRISKQGYLMVLVAGPKQIAWPALRKHLNISRISMANQDEVLSLTGYKRGAVSPLGLPVPMRILVDTSLLDQDEISIGSGQQGVAVILRQIDLIKAIGEPEVVDVLDSE